MTQHALRLEVAESRAVIAATQCCSKKLQLPSYCSSIADVFPARGRLPLLVSQRLCVHEYPTYFLRTQCAPAELVPGWDGKKIIDLFHVVVCNCVSCPVWVQRWHLAAALGVSLRLRLIPATASKLTEKN